MATTYQLSATASDLTGSGGQFSKALVASGATTGSVTVTSGDFYAFTPAANPSDQGTAGNFTVNISCGTPQFGGAVLNAFVSRVNAAGTEVGGPVGSSSGGGFFTTAGVQSFGFTAPSLGTWTAGDRLKVRISVSSTVDVNFSSSSTVVAPWSLNIDVAPTAGSITATGYSPTVAVTQHKFVAAGSGSVAITAEKPKLVFGIAPTAGAVTVTGYQATVTAGVGTIVAIGGAVTVTGFAPAITWDDRINLAPQCGEISVTGYSPSLNFTLKPGAGTVTLTGSQPFVEAPHLSTPSTGDITVTGYQATLHLTDNQLVAPTAGAITVAGETASLILGLSPGAGNVVVTGQRPIVLAPYVLSPSGGGSITITGSGVTVAITQNKYIAASSGDIVVTGGAPSVVRIPYRQMSGEFISRHTLTGVM